MDNTVIEKIKPTIKLLLIYGGIVVGTLAVIGVLWLTLGVHELTISITVAFGIAILICVPACFIWSLRLGTITIYEDKVIYWSPADSGNVLQVIPINQIQSVRVVSKAEIKQYDEKSNAKKSLLFDLGGENVKYVVINIFTQTQVQNLVRLIEERIALKCQG